jgi:S-adenosylmethionine synthetase
VTIVTRSRVRLDPGAQDIEVVERKGLGHPDSICDALSEEVSRALCRYYLERFGRVLHHNVDKVLLVGGSSEPRFGGGDITRPVEIFVAGRATAEWNGSAIPVADLTRDACLSWIQSHLRADVLRHVRITPLVRPGSTDLRALFARGSQSVLANDTSCGAGFAPLSPLERLVLQVENALNSASIKTRYPGIGEDVKVMAVRHLHRVTMTIACAMVDRFIRDASDYADHKLGVQHIAMDLARSTGSFDVTVHVNAADDEASDIRYLTVTGTSAEAGDDGETGRGNRSSGLITPYRMMTMEAAAGKNPVSHVGKLYQLMAADLSRRIVNDITDIKAAECLLVSEIGRPVSDPHFVDVAIDTPAVHQATRSRIEELATDVLESADALTDDLIHGRRQVF